jgi:predicted O-linked N-acetylglucosamine transferase (SPINDLY family)
VHEDGIDILIDIAGHTGHNRLGVFARKPAPVQVTWLDYLCTTGLAAMDYRLTDAVADPAGNEHQHRERLLRMPHAQWCWQPDPNSPPVAALPAAASGTVTFGSFNHAQKLTDATLSLWRQLLQALPAARLHIGGIAEGVARQRVRDALACDDSRLSFLPRVDVTAPPIVCRRRHRADPLPFSGATTVGRPVAGGRCAAAGRAAARVRPPAC